MPRKKADELFSNVIENNAGQRASTLIHISRDNNLKQINITIEVLFNVSTRDLEDMVCVLRS